MSGPGCTRAKGIGPVRRFGLRERQQPDALGTRKDQPGKYTENKDLSKRKLPHRSFIE